MDMNRRKRTRKCFSYKFSMWFWSSHRKEAKFVLSCLIELFTVALMFAALFILPHCFH